MSIYKGFKHNTLADVLWAWKEDISKVPKLQILLFFLIFVWNLIIFFSYKDDCLPFRTRGRMMGHITSNLFESSNVTAKWVKKHVSNDLRLPHPQYIRIAWHRVKVKAVMLIISNRKHLLTILIILICIWNLNIFLWSSGKG